MSRSPKEAGGPDYSRWRILTSPGVWYGTGILTILGGIGDSVSTSNTQTVQKVDRVIPPVSQIELKAAETVIAHFDNTSHERIMLGDDTIVIPRITDSNNLRQSLTTKDNYLKRQELMQKGQDSNTKNNTDYRGVKIFTLGAMITLAGILKQTIDSIRFKSRKPKTSPESFSSDLDF